MEGFEEKGKSNGLYKNNVGHINDEARISVNILYVKMEDFTIKVNQGSALRPCLSGTVLGGGGLCGS